MGHDHDQAHDHDQVRTLRTSSLEPTPGRSSRSASLVGPQVPMISGLVQRKGSGNVAHDAGEHVARAGGNGSALPAELRARFESSLGTDLSAVRVHTDAASQRATSAVGARAFALGNDVHFAAGQYDPSSQAGQRLIAHEVAHTVQQRGGSPAPQYKLEVSSAGDACEHEADVAADAMITGAPASVSTAGGIVMRAEEEAPAEEAPKPRYPSWKDKTFNLPLGKHGGLDVTYGDTPKVEFSAKAGAKHTLFERKLSQGVQLVPGIFASLTGGVEVTAAASASVTGGGSWFLPEGAPPDSEQAATFSVGGKGDVSLGAKGSLQLSLGAGVANVLGIQGGIEGAIEAKGTASVSVLGSMTKLPDGSEKGVSMLTIGVGATIEATAAAKVDVVIPGDAVNVYECELGKLELATASVTCMTQYANGQLTDLPPIVKWQLLPISASPPRPKRPLTAEEKKKYVHHSEVEEGASGNGAGGEQAPDEVEMSDQELLDGGKREAADAIAAASRIELAFLQSSQLNGVMFGNINIDGVPVRAICAISPAKARSDREHGRKVTDVTKGVISSVDMGFATIDLLNNTAKSTTAVKHAILRKHVELSVTGTEFNYTQVPMERCLKEDPAPQPFAPGPIPGPDSMPQLKQG